MPATTDINTLYWSGSHCPAGPGRDTCLQQQISTHCTGPHYTVLQVLGGTHACNNRHQHIVLVRITLSCRSWEGHMPATTDINTLYWSGSHCPAGPGRDTCLQQQTSTHSTGPDHTVLQVLGGTHACNNRHQHTVLVRITLSCGPGRDTCLQQQTSTHCTGPDHTVLQVLGGTHACNNRHQHIVLVRITLSCRSWEGHMPATTDINTLRITLSCRSWEGHMPATTDINTLYWSGSHCPAGPGRDTCLQQQTSTHCTGLDHTVLQVLEGTHACSKRYQHIEASAKWLAFGRQHFKSFSWKLTVL